DGAHFALRLHEVWLWLAAHDRREDVEMRVPAGGVCVAVRAGHAGMGQRQQRAGAGLCDLDAHIAFVVGPAFGARVLPCESERVWRRVIGNDAVDRCTDSDLAAGAWFDCAVIGPFRAELIVRYETPHAIHRDGKEALEADNAASCIELAERELISH